jgi:uncharacterized protein with HEPN domain
VTARDFRFLIDDMQQAVNAIARMIGGIDLAAFAADEMRQKAIIRDLAVLGEAAGRLPAELRARAPDVPWRLMIAMRNQLIHGYFLVDLAIVYQTATQDVPALRDPLERLRPTLDAD